MYGVCRINLGNLEPVSIARKLCVDTAIGVDLAKSDFMIHSTPDPCIHRRYFQASDPSTGIAWNQVGTYTKF